MHVQWMGGTGPEAVQIRTCLKTRPCRQLVVQSIQERLAPHLSLSCKVSRNDS